MIKLWGFISNYLFFAELAGHSIISACSAGRIDHVGIILVSGCGSDLDLSIAAMRAIIGRFDGSCADGTVGFIGKRDASEIPIVSKRLTVFFLTEVANGSVYTRSLAA